MPILSHFSVVSLLVFLWTSCFAISQELGTSYFFYQQPEYPRDCKEVRDSCNTEHASGVFQIKPDGYHKPFEVYCDNEDDGGGWTVILRRQDGSVTFERDWMDYKIGFGFPSHGFWLGNEKLSYLTNQKEYELRIDFVYSDGSVFYALYNAFRIGDEFGHYSLVRLGLFSGTARFTTCSANKEYTTCTCEKSCKNLDVCLVTCTEDETCICPDGFFIQGEDCVPQENCGCFVEGKIIKEGEVHVTSACSRRCSCSAGQLVCDDLQCSPDAVCEERDNLRQCYCKPGFTGNGISCISSTPPTDCLDVFNKGNTTNGIYNIKPTSWSGSPLEVYCNMTDGGGWTVIQRRVDGTVDFDLYWDDFKDGFGSPDHELWLGNAKMYSITNQRRYQLRIDFVNEYGAPYYAKYGFFRINNEANNYRLTVENYREGDAGDSLTRYHNNEDFSTRDEDNDDYSSYHVAAYSDYGAWWWGYDYYYYYHSDLNAPYDSSDIYWGTLPGSYYYIKFTEMKIRPV